MTTRELLDPDVEAGAALVPFDELNAELVAAVRPFFAAPSAPSAVVDRTEHVVSGASDEPAVPVRVHRAKGATGVAPCIYTIHGGGYVIGSNTMDDPQLEKWCPTLGIVGVSVDYRLAPDTPYPGPLEDCYRGLVWTYEHADELGIDPEGIGVMGVSAGGGLAAALALLARDRGEVPLAFQLLDSPMIDDRQTTASSRVDDLAVWSRGSNTFGWKSYLGDLYGRDDIPATAAPARATDLSGLPPALVSVGAVDGFRDEDIDYALRLNQAGVPTELHVYPGACHGFTMFAPDAAVSKQSLRNMEDWLRRFTGAGA